LCRFARTRCRETAIPELACTVRRYVYYDSLCNLAASTGTVSNPFQFTGREFDPETGLYFYRARYYDPSTGRFLSEDPIGFNAGSNFYRYVYNDPVVFLDPSGWDPLTPAQGRAIASTAASWIGVPYKFGGHSKSGADCSGSTWAIYAQAGFKYSAAPVSTVSFTKAMVKPTATPGYFFPVENPRPGDVMLWPSHMAIYDPNAKSTCSCSTQQGSNMFSATHRGGPPYGPYNSRWWFGGNTPVYYRYDTPAK
jgi:RHS repeat-associated protein